MDARTAALGLVSLITLLRLWVASRVGLGDAEAYYWTWSRHLDLSYYDHGPVVALLIRLGTTLIGDSSLGVRLPFIVLSALTLWLVWRIAAGAGGHGAGLWAVVCLLAMPVFVVAGGAANPDVPFLALVAAFTAMLLPPAREGKIPWRPALCGLVVGLSFSTKYFGLVLMIPLLVWAWRQRPRWLSVAAALGGALLGASPVILWNAAHGWASVAYHAGARHTRPAGPSLENLGKLLGGQLGYVSPLVLAALMATVVYLWRRRDEERCRSLLWIASPLLGAGYLLIAVVPSAEPHWPVAGYLPLALALGGAMPAWLRRRRVRTLTWIALAFSGVAALVFHVHILADIAVRLMPASYNARYDLSNELRGWDLVAERVSHHTGTGLVVGCHYTTCAQLAFAARGRYRVACPSPRVDQFDFFPGGDGTHHKWTDDFIYVRDERFPWDAAQLYDCAVSGEVSAVTLVRAGRVARRFSIQTCEGFRGLRIKRWPPPKKGSGPPPRQ